MSVDISSVKEALYKKYILPTKRKAEAYVGVEFELPIVNLKKEAVDFSLIHRLTGEFIKHFGFENIKYDDKGEIYSISDNNTKDDLSFDCSYNTIEFSFGREKDINVLHKRFEKYYKFVKEFLEKDSHTITGMGINPYRQYNKNIPIPNGRYRMLFHHLSSYKKYGGQMMFHDIPNFGLFSCASQTHIDVSGDDLLDSINTFNKIEPLKALLFANSPLNDRLLARDYLWNHSLHGLNNHNVDGYSKEIKSINEIVSYIESMSIYCLERDGKYINFSPTPLDDFFSGSVISGEYWNGTEYQEIDFEPRLADLEYLRSFKYVDLTYRGTVELRSVCEQPINEIFAAPAFHAGLKANLKELSKYLDSLDWIYNIGYTINELRNMFTFKQKPAFLDESRIKDVLISIISIAAEGLRKRNYGESFLLEPLFNRAKNLQSPAAEMQDGIDKGRSLEYYIAKFG